MSESVAAAGTCPAQAHRMQTRAAGTSRTVKIELRFMLGSYFIATPGIAPSDVSARIGRRPRCRLRWRRNGGRQGLTDRKPHGGNLLLLGNDDLLGEPPDLGVAAVAKHGDCHVDRALMMRHHHCYEVGID